MNRSNAATWTPPSKAAEMSEYPARVVVCAVVAGLLLAPRVAAAADVQADPTNYQQQLGTLKPGDTLHLAAGHYTWLALSNLNGTSSSWITVTGPAASPPTAVIDAGTDGCCNIVEITNSSFLAVENLLIDGHHVDGAFGISAKNGTSNLVHDVRIEDCALVNMDGSGDQDNCGISTKTPTWGWIIRHNVVTGAGTGLYLGNSDGTDPFVGGLIEDNLVQDPIGYCMEIKWQQPRPTVPGMPTQPTTTIVRNNVWIKDDQPSPLGDRPNVLFGGFPASGAGSQDRYEMYGNLFYHNPRESLFQASGRVTVHDNIFVDAPANRAILFRNHDLPLELAYAYNNTIYGTSIGIDFGSAAPQGDGVVGNLIFAATPITGTITNQHDNLTDVQASAGQYVNHPSTTLGQMDFYPLPGKCQGSPIDESLFAMDTDYSKDFNGTSKGTFTFRGAYAGSGTNPGWPPGDGNKDGGPGGDGGVSGSSGGGDGGGSSGGSAGDAGAANGASPTSPSGCGCVLAGSPADADAVGAAMLLAALIALRTRRQGGARWIAGHRR